MRGKGCPFGQPFPFCGKCAAIVRDAVSMQMVSDRYFAAARLSLQQKRTLFAFFFWYNIFIPL